MEGETLTPVTEQETAVTEQETAVTGQEKTVPERLTAQQREEIVKELAEAAGKKTVLRSVISNVNKGGLVTDYKGVEVFIPASLVSDVFSHDLEQYKDKELEYIISEEDLTKKNRIIGDRRAVLEAEKERKTKAFFDSTKAGDVLEGTVRNVTDFGVFVEFEGAVGLLHISEIGWGHVGKPSDIYKKGDSVKVKVLSADPQTKKVSLSAKLPENDPWNKAADKYPDGSIVTGTVARMTDFGAFVELEPGIDALLHVSEISSGHVEKPSDVFKIGEVITATVKGTDVKARRISLTTK